MMRAALLISVLSAVLLLPSCKKDEGGNACTGGRAGAVTLTAYPKHHSKAVRPYKVYIRYNSQDAPASLGGYDYSKDADTTKDHIAISSLQCGDYYVYMSGYDPAIQDSVFGGMPFSIPESASGNMDLTFPVTE